MATKKSKANGKNVKTVKGMTATIVLDAFDGSSMYVNHAEIGHSQHEFIMLWAQVSARQSRAQMEEIQTTGELRVEPMAQLMIPPTLLPSLIRALVNQKEKYEKEHGKIFDAAKEK